MKTKSRALVRAVTRISRCVAVCLSAAHVVASGARAQETSDVDSLARQVAAVNSTIRSAEARVAAARARVSPAGAWQDPMLMLGVMNVMIGGEKSPAHGVPMGPDPMRMNVVGIEQTIPFPGKPSLARRDASAMVREAEAELASIRLDIQARVRQAYYDAAFQTRALEVVGRNADLLSALIAASEARYVSAGGSQVDVLNARVEATRLGETAAELVEAPAPR